MGSWWSSQPAVEETPSNLLIDVIKTSEIAAPEPNPVESQFHQVITVPVIEHTQVLPPSTVNNNEEDDEEEEEEQEQEEKNESGKRVKKEDNKSAPETKKQKTEVKTEERPTAIKRSATPKKPVKKEKEEKVKIEKEPKTEQATPKKRGPGRPKKQKPDDEFVPSDDDSKTTTKSKKLKMEKEEKSTPKKEKTLKTEKSTSAKTPKAKTAKKEANNDNNAAPADLLTEYRQASAGWGGLWISGFKFDLANPRKALQNLLEATEKDKRLDQISLFAQAGRKGFFAFWKHSEDLEETPVIYLGPEGEAWLVASSLSQFIAMQAAGLDGEMLRAWDGKDEEFESPEKYEEAYDNFLKWAKSKKIKPLAKSKVFKTMKQEKSNHPQLKSFLFPQGKHDQYESDD